MLFFVYAVVIGLYDLEFCQGRILEKMYGEVGRFLGEVLP